MRVVILLGPPGAGKGTQARRLGELLGIPHVATGDLFRDNLARGTELGREARGYMDAGSLVPDQVVLGMLFDRLDRPDARGGYLLDGFPRTVPQAEALEERLPEGADVQRLLLEVDDATLIERAAGRRVCERCGHIHHLKHSPPRKAGACDVCGGKLLQRKDDQEPIVRRRLEVYRAETAPVIGWYEARGGLQRVDGSLEPDAVFEALRRCLKEAA
jgi:adenylate kinase